MNKVLVIEPYKMLQQALAVALLPDYQLQFADALAADGNAGEFDIVIVDVAALAETAGAAATTVQAVLDWQVPTVLIEGAQTSPTAERQGVIRIKTPLGKDSLRLALAQCVAGASASPVASAAAPAAARRAKAKETAKQPKPITAPALAAEENRDLIELVDVIEEPE